MHEAALKFFDPAFIVAMLVIGLFGYAYIQNANDETMKGALIAGFNIAVGYYIGATRTADKTASANRDAITAFVASKTADQ